MAKSLVLMAVIHKLTPAMTHVCDQKYVIVLDEGKHLTGHHLNIPYETHNVTSLKSYKNICISNETIKRHYKWFNI